MLKLIFSRFFSSAMRMAEAPAAPAPEASALYADLGSLSLIEVSDASALAGAMFRKAFNADIPRQPRHFVLLRRTGDNNPMVLGYVHHTKLGAAYCAGGLVVAAMEFRRLDAETAQLVREQGGLAEWTMRTTCNWLNDANAVFAYIGDAKSVRVNLRVGFVPTEHKHLHVLWHKDIGAEARQALVDKIAAIGPF